MSRVPVEKKFIRRLMPFLAAAVTFAVFLPALKNGFVNWDDLNNLVENQKYKGLGWEQLKWMFTTAHLGPYQPLSWLTLGLDHRIWGMAPFGFHLTNVVLHSLNALVFYFLCVKLLALAVRPFSPEMEKELPLAAGFAALFFAIHPLRVESVAWVSERRDVLSGLFYLLAILWYLTPRSAGGERAPFWRRHALPLAAFLLSLLSKGMAISLPVTLVVLDIYPLRRLPGGTGKWFSRETRRVWLEKLPFFALAAVFGAIGYICQAEAGALASYQKFGFASRAAQSLFAVVFYIRKTLLPFDLSPLYKLPDGFGLLNGQSLFAGAVIAAITAAAVVLRRRRPAGLAVWSCYLAALSPVAGMVKLGVQSAADRYTYLPCLGFAVLAGAGFLSCRRAAGGHIRKICAITACVILSGFAFLTWRQERIWRDSETLWTHALSLNPELDYAHNNLGGVLEERGELARAARHYGEALRINPKNAKAHSNLADIYAAQGKFDQAAGRYLEALKINPGYIEARYNLGNLLAEYGRVDEAAGRYLEVLKLAPDFAQAHNNLAGILAARGRIGEAAGHCREALKSSPDFAEAHLNLAGLLAAQGDLDGAVKHYLEALRVNPDSAQAHYKLSIVLSVQGQRGPAAEHYRRALQIDPNIGGPRGNRGG